MPSAPLRIGMLGTGHIASEYAAALAGTGELRLQAVASRDLQTASDFAQRFGIAKAYGDYAALLAAPDIDAVYVALPNSLHAEWAIRAAEHGKHILCEKPLAPTLAEVERMFAAADRHGVVLLEAFPYFFQPQSLELERIVAAGEIGIVRSVHAAMGFSLSSPSNIRLNAALAGGALLDAGCYPVSFARFVIGARPVAVHAFAELGDSGVDATTAAILRFPSGAVAQISCSIATGLHRTAVIAGSQGIVETSYSNHTNAERPGVLRIKRGTGWDHSFEDIATSTGNGLLLETLAFARLLRAPDELAQYRCMSLDNAATLTAIVRSAATGAVVAIAT